MIVIIDRLSLDRQVRYQHNDSFTLLFPGVVNGGNGVRIRLLRFSVVPGYELRLGRTFERI
jgi:hypothetical protein